MNGWILFAIYWILCIVGTYAVRIYNKKKNKLLNVLLEDKTPVGKIILTHLGIFIFIPIAMPFVLIYMAFKGVKSHYYRNRPRPVPKERRKYLKPDTVFDKNNTSMSLAEYNFKHDSNFTLDQVYGRGYQASLSEEQIKDFHKNNENHGVLQVTDNVRDDEYTSFAVDFAKALIGGDFGVIEKSLSEHVETILYQNRTISGKNQTLDYWKVWREKYIVTKKLSQFEVKHSNYYSHACLLIRPMLVMLYFEEGRVQKILLINRYLNPNIGYHNDMLDLPFSYEKIKLNLSPLREPNEILEAVVKENRIPCMCCGESSENLEWYNSEFKSGIHGYSGQVSVCPHCGKVVEYYPEMRMRYEEAVHDKDDEIKNNAGAEPDFSPRLYGLNVFENTTPLKGTGYVESLPDDTMADANLPFSGSNPEFGPCSIKQVGEEANWIVLRRVKTEYPEWYEEIKKCYRTAFDDGLFEAANVLGIIAYNFDERYDEGIEWFNKSVVCGSRDAQLNKFTILWTEEKYRECGSFLEELVSKEKSSLKCLWNLAFLLYYGNDYPNNPIEKDYEKAKSVLKMIADYNHSDISANDLELPERASRFLDYIEKGNIYSEKGKSYHKILTESVVQTDILKDKQEVFSQLNSIGMKQGYHLGLRLADMNTSAIGDESNFFAYDEYGKEDTDIIKYIKVNPSAMAAWQIYLLKTSPTMMPVFWHGGYIRRKFIFQEADVNSIDVFKYLDTSGLVGDKGLLPHVSFMTTGENEEHIADVYCCYWNEWKGLVREHAQITMRAGEISKYEIVSNDVLYEYDCGIRY